MNHSINANRCSRLSARRGQAQGLRPWEPRQRRCLYTPQGASRAGRGEPPLDPAARFLRRLAAEENAWQDSEGWGDSRWRKGRSFSTLHRNGLPSRSLPTSRKSWEGGRWGSGGGGRKALLQKGFLPPPPARRVSPYQAVQRWRHSGMILPCSLRSVRNLSDSSGLVKVKSER